MKPKENYFSFRAGCLKNWNATAIAKCVVTFGSGDNPIHK